MRFWKKTVSILLVHAFLLSGITTGLMPSAIATTLDKTSPIIEVATTPDSIVIPKDCGMIKSKFIGKGDKLIVHIQDAHCNYEAQSNIAGIIENLVKNNGLSLVSVEGADGMIDTSWFKAFPDAEVRKEVANYFMKKGEITGPEFLSITTDYPIKLFGAETRDYYIQNLNAFTTSYPLKGETEKYLNNIKAALTKLQALIYNADLKAMAAKSNEYEAKKMQFNDYVRFLQDEAQKHKINLRQYEDLFKLINVLIYEKKIDFSVTDKERSALIDEMSKAVSKDVLTELVNKSIAFKVNKISSAEYYAYVRGLAQKNKVDLLEKYPNLYNYIIYNSVYSRINNEGLFNDIKKLEIAIKEKLFENEDQRTLEKLSRHIDTLIGLVNIKLLNDDFDYYKANKAEFAPEAFSDFIKAKTIQFGLAYEMDPPADAIAKNIDRLEDFYAIAIKRDKAMVDNTLEAMNKTGSKIAVLVTGGFHSEGMMKLLERQGVSHMVVCPSITKEAQTPYIQILMNQRTSFEDILTTPKEAVKKNMLAPLPRTWATGEVYAELKGKSDILNDGDLENFRNEWIERNVSEWLSARRNIVFGNRASTRSVLEDAFKLDFMKSATEVYGVDRTAEAQAQRLCAEVMKSSAFERVFNSMMPATGVIGVMPPTRPTSAQGAVMVVNGELSPEQTALVNQAIRDDFETVLVNANEPTYTYKIPSSEITVEIFRIPSLEACDNFLFAHPGHGGAVRAIGRNRIYMSPLNYERLRRLKEFAPEAYSSFFNHEAYHLVNPNATEAAAEAASKTNNVRVALENMAKADVAAVRMNLGQTPIGETIYRFSNALVPSARGLIGPTNTREELPRRLSALFIGANGRGTDSLYKALMVLESQGEVKIEMLKSGTAIFSKSTPVSLAEAYSSPESFEAYMTQHLARLSVAIPELSQLMEGYNSWRNEMIAPKEAQLNLLQIQPGKEQAVKELRDEIDNLIKPKVAAMEDLIATRFNQPLAEGYVGLLKGITSERNFLREIPTLEEFMKSPAYTETLDRARELFLSPTCGDLDVYAGAASRLFGEGQRADTTRSFAAHDVYQMAASMGKAIPSHAILGESIMTRMAVQKWIDIEADLKEKYNGSKTPEAIVAQRQAIIATKPWIIVINDESGVPLLKEMVENNHYGYNPENVVFVVQPTFNGYGYDNNGKPVMLKNTKPNPAGHGSATLQSMAPGRAFWVGSNGAIHNIEEDAEAYLKGRTGANFWIQGRVNDMIKLGYTTRPHQLFSSTHELDMGVMALALSRMGNIDKLEEGKNAILEQVAPDSRIKGGTPLVTTSRSDGFLIEGVAMNPETKKVVLIPDNPQNRFYIYYKGLALREMKKQGLPVYFRFRDGAIYPETVTGDLTMLKRVNPGYVMAKRPLDDYKNEATIDNGLNAADHQDKNPKFRAATEELKTSRKKDVTITGLNKVPDFAKHLEPAPEAPSARAKVNAQNRVALKAVEKPASGLTREKTAVLVPPSSGTLEAEVYAAYMAFERPYDVTVNAFRGSINKPELLRALIAKFPGTNNVSTLNNMERSGIAVVTNMNESSYDLTDNFFKSDVLNRFVMLQAGREQITDIKAQASSMSDVERIIVDSMNAELFVNAFMPEGANVLPPSEKIETQYEVVIALSEGFRDKGGSSEHSVFPSVIDRWLQANNPEEYWKYRNIGRYTKELRQRLEALRVSGNAMENKAIVILHDRMIDSTGVAQAAEFAVERYLGGSVIVVRGSGSMLISHGIEEYNNLIRNTNAPKNAAIIALTGTNRTSITGKDRADLLRVMMAGNAAAEKIGGLRPLSVLLQVDDSEGEMSTIELYNAAVTIGFNLGAQNILDCLRRIALTDSGERFTDAVMDEIIKTGFIRLKPIAPINPNQIDEVRRAEAVALRSL